MGPEGQAHTILIEQLLSSRPPPPFHHSPFCRRQATVIHRSVHGPRGPGPRHTDRTASHSPPPPPPHLSVIDRPQPFIGVFIGPEGQVHAVLIEQLLSPLPPPHPHSPFCHRQATVVHRSVHGPRGPGPHHTDRTASPALAGARLGHRS